jgi:cysteine desulfurase
MKRIYLDHNSTGPLCRSFIEALGVGDIPFENSSSQHSSGKKVSQYIKKIDKQILEHFKLSAVDFGVLYHSGATEAVNQFLNLGEGDFLVYFSSDHPCVLAMAESLKARGVDTYALKIDSSGGFDTEVAILNIKNANKLNKQVVLHFTYMHNETGIIWDLTEAQKIKSATSAIIYVDAVQSPGKFESYNKLNSGLDIYTFSGHKFGALKGIGFSLFNKNLVINPLVLGGGQQSNLRSGTMNNHGIASLAFALKELAEVAAKKKILMELKYKIIKLLEVKNDISIIENDSNNTVCFVHDSIKADIMMVHFDLAGLDVSSGSACASGSIDASQTLIDMGFGKKAKNGIRISLGMQNLKETGELLSRLEAVLNKL